MLVFGYKVTINLPVACIWVIINFFYTKREKWYHIGNTELTNYHLNSRLLRRK